MESRLCTVTQDIQWPYKISVWKQICEKKSKEFHERQCWWLFENLGCFTTTANFIIFGTSKGGSTKYVYCFFLLSNTLSVLLQLFSFVGFELWLEWVWWKCYRYRRFRWPNPDMGFTFYNKSIVWIVWLWVGRTKNSIFAIQF